VGERLRPHRYDDGVVGVAWVEEKDRDVASGDHFGGGEPMGHGGILQPHRQAALDLDGGGVGTAVEGLQDSFFYHGLLITSPPVPLSSRRGGRKLAGGYPQTPTRGNALWTPLGSRLRGNDREGCGKDGGGSGNEGWGYPFQATTRFHHSHQV
jgi:hypothetical protein